MTISVRDVILSEDCRLRSAATKREGRGGEGNATLLMMVRPPAAINDDRPAVSPLLFRAMAKERREGGREEEGKYQSEMPAVASLPLQTTG